jgi:hypothetical protein
MTDLSRRHFECIAEIIRALPTHEQSEEIARHFANRLPATNSRFNTHRFIRACTDSDYTYAEGRSSAPNY